MSRPFEHKTPVDDQLNWQKRFERCSDREKYPSFKMMPGTIDHVGERVISPAAKIQWYEECKTRLKDKPSLLPACTFGQHFLRDVTYIPFDEFYRGLLQSFATFLTQQGTRSYAFLLDPRKYGSEHWLLQLLWQDIFLKSPSQLPGVVVEPNLKDDPRDIVLLDDVVYSGFHTMGVIDLFYDNARRKGIIIPPNRYHFHIVIPFMSSKGEKLLRTTLPEITQSPVSLYPVKILPSFLELEEKLGANLSDLGYVEDEPRRPSSRHPPVATDEVKSKAPTDKVKRYHLASEVAEELNLNPHGVFLPVYLDFKIAKNTSTATSILESLVRPLPSRRPLLAAEECFNHI